MEIRYKNLVSRLLKTKLEISFLISCVSGINLKSQKKIDIKIKNNDRLLKN